MPGDAGRHSPDQKAAQNYGIGSRNQTEINLQKQIDGNGQVTEWVKVNNTQKTEAVIASGNIKEDDDPYCKH